MKKKPNRYTRLVEEIFTAHYRPGMAELSFNREEIEKTASYLGVKLPKNLGDLIYSFRFRSTMPERITSTAPMGKAWLIKLSGRGRYRFVLADQWNVAPNPTLLKIKVPDATPGIIARHALDDEQALLALVRYNRLIDMFTGVTCYSLQNHLRTSVENIGQIEVDELYVGLDRRGAHYVMPVQAKGGRDKMSVVQIEQDIAMCGEKFPQLICRPIGAQFLSDGGIALFEFVETEDGVRVSAERHYVLVSPDDLTKEDLTLYRTSGKTP